MLVLHPRTFTETDALPGMPGVMTVGVKVKVGGTTVAAPVFVGKGVVLAVDVNTTGVEEALVTPMITGVAVKIDGVGVKGRKGVGGLYGKG